MARVEICAWTAISPVNREYPLHPKEFLLYMAGSMLCGSVVGVASSYFARMRRKGASILGNMGKRGAEYASAGITGFQVSSLMVRPLFIYSHGLGSIADLSIVMCSPSCGRNDVKCYF
jgi:hypothetical protein